jgi:hypothetical protein
VNEGNSYEFPILCSANGPVHLPDCQEDQKVIVQLVVEIMSWEFTRVPDIRPTHSEISTHAQHRGNAFESIRTNLEQALKRIDQTDSHPARYDWHKTPTDDGIIVEFNSILFRPRIFR